MNGRAAAAATTAATNREGRIGEEKKMAQESKVNRRSVSLEQIGLTENKQTAQSCSSILAHNLLVELQLALIR